MSGGLGGTVNAEFKVDAAKAAADLQDLVKKFSAVEKAVQAASKGLDTQGASTAAVNAAHKELARQLERSTGAVKVSEKEWVKYAATLYTIHNVASLVGRSLMNVYEAAAEGAKIQAAQQFFENAGKSIESYRKATNGMISDAELMKKANLADSMGIDEATFKKLVVVAEASALKTGQSFDHMFNSIIVGTARSSRLLLDNLGIIVSVEQANESYARKVLEVGGAHKATQAEINSFIEAMTAEQKQIAFVEEVAKKSQGTIDEYGKIVDKTAQNFAQLEATAQNLADTIKIALTGAFTGALGPLSSLLTLMQRFIKDKGLVIGGLAGIGAGVLDAFGWLNGTKKSVSEEFNRTLEAEATTAKMQERNFSISEGLTALDLIDKQSGESLAAVARRFVNLGSTGSQSIDALIADFLRFSKGASDFFADQLKLFEKAPPATTPTTKPKDLTGSGGAPAPVDFTRRNENFRDSIAEKIGSALEKKIKEEYDAKLAVLDKVEKMKAKADQLDKAAGKHDLKGEENFADYNQRLKEEAEKAFKATVAQIDEVVTSIVGSLRNLASALIQGVAGIAEALMGQGGLMAAIGQLAGGILEGAGGLLQTLVSAAGSAFSELTFGISAIVAKPLNAMISVFTEGGAAALSAFGKFGDTMAPIIELMTYLGDVLYGVQNALGDSFLVAAGVMREAVTRIGRSLELLAQKGLFESLATGFASVLDLLSRFMAVFALFYDSISMGGSAFTTALQLIIPSLQMAANNLLLLNDVIVSIVRSLGQDGWGKLSSELTLEYDPKPMEDNTSAVRENTAALRDFAREFRNLPANFKAEGYIFDARASDRPNPLVGATFAPGMGTNNQRPRT